MPLPLFFSIALMIILAYVIFRVLSDIAKGLVLFLIVLLAYFIVFKSLPEFGQVPLIGKYLSIQKLKSAFYRLEILSITRSADNSLLVAVKNSGLLPLTNFSVLVDNKPVNITNNPKDPLYPFESTILQVDWKKKYSNLTISTNQLVSSL